MKVSRSGRGGRVSDHLGGKYRLDFTRDGVRVSRSLMVSSVRRPQYRLRCGVKGPWSTDDVWSVSGRSLVFLGLRGDRVHRGERPRLVYATERKVP